MSVWIPIIVTVAAIVVWLLLVYPGRWRAEASILATVVLWGGSILIWLVYGGIHLFKWVKATLAG